MTQPITPPATEPPPPPAPESAPRPPARRHRWPVLLGLLLVPLVAGWLAGRHLPEGAANAKEPPLRPDFTLNDLEGQPRNVSHWDGHILVVNFWATWCPPCRKEIPHFIELQQGYGGAGVQFLGIAIDDADDVRRFVNDHAVIYPNLVGEADAMAVSRAFGNEMGALPYTAVVDFDGRVVFTYQGELSRKVLEDVLISLLPPQG